MKETVGSRRIVGVKTYFEADAMALLGSTMAGNFATAIRNLFQMRCAQILVVEDEPDLQEIFAEFFGSRGYGVKVAGTLEQAEAFLKSERFDVVLQGVVLPDGNGVEALRNMKLEYPELPVIILTAMGHHEATLQAAMRNGASAYISKLLPLDQVLMEIRRVIKSTASRPSND